MTNRRALADAEAQARTCLVTQLSMLSAHRSATGKQTRAVDQLLSAAIAAPTLVARPIGTAPDRTDDPSAIPSDHSPTTLRTA